MTRQFDEYEYGYDDNYFYTNPITTPFITPTARQAQNSGGGGGFSVLFSALRKSLVTCTASAAVDVADDVSTVEIGSPTDVRHVSHVTFDRFTGFVGLPVELEFPGKVPSASVSVFGVSPESMQCSYDQRGNSVPTILLMMQKRLYSEGGLHAEGIFRINAEDSQEQYVRKQLNKGFVSRGLDVHCLAGLIKAWFRELPTGVLDSLTPEQVLHCNSEEDCILLVNSLPSTEASLLDWAINLMADVVKYEHENKMNARNIAMVFAPNMTQMADPLTALLHAVQVMNLLKTLIIRTLREREESASVSRPVSSNQDSPPRKHTSHSLSSIMREQSFERNLLRSATLDRLGCESEERFWSFHNQNEEVEVCERVSDVGPTNTFKTNNLENGSEIEGVRERLNLRKGVRRLCRHPVFQLSKSIKKAGDLVT